MSFENAIVSRDSAAHPVDGDYMVRDLVRKCPWCGCRRVVLRHRPYMDTNVWSVMCCLCESQGPHIGNGNTFADAIRFWEYRPPYKWRQRLFIAKAALRRFYYRHFNWLRENRNKSH